MLKNKVDEKEKIIEENSKLLGSYQKEVSFCDELIFT